MYATNHSAILFSDSLFPPPPYHPPTTAPPSPPCHPITCSNHGRTSVRTLYTRIGNADAPFSLQFQPEARTSRGQRFPLTFSIKQQVAHESAHSDHPLHQTRQKVENPTAVHSSSSSRKTLVPADIEDNIRRHSWRL